MQGPGFNPDVHIEDWSEDSSQEDDTSHFERTDEEIIEDLLRNGPML